MSGWIRFAAAAVLAVAVVGCGANGGDPVAGQQIPAGPADSPQESMGSGSDAGSEAGSDQGGSGGTDSAGGGSDGSDQGGSRGGGGSGSGGHAPKVGLPKSIRISEVGGLADLQGSIAAACGSKDGAPGCLTVTYQPATDPDAVCPFEWKSHPPAASADGNGTWLVQRGSSIVVTICPPPGDTTSPAPEDTTSAAPEDTMSPAPDDEQVSTSDSPTASP